MSCDPPIAKAPRNKIFRAISRTFPFHACPLKYESRGFFLSSTFRYAPANGIFLLVDKIVHHWSAPHDSMTKTKNPFIIQTILPIYLIICFFMPFRYFFLTITTRQQKTFQMRNDCANGNNLSLKFQSFQSWKKEYTVRIFDING